MLAQRTPILLRESKYWRVAAIQALNSNTHLVHQWLGPHYMYNNTCGVEVFTGLSRIPEPGLQRGKQVLTYFDGVSIFSGGFFKRFQSFGIVLPYCSFPATQDSPLTIYNPHFIITVSLSLSVFDWYLYRNLFTAGLLLLARLPSLLISPSLNYCNFSSFRAIQNLVKLVSCL